MAVSTAQRSDSAHFTVTPREGGRAYALIWFIQLLAVFSMATVTLGLTIYKNSYDTLESHGVLLLAVAFSLTFIPFSLASPLGGLFADRWGPKKTLLISNTGCLVLLVLSSIFLAAGWLPGWWVWAAVLPAAGCKSIQITGLDAAVPNMLPKRYISRGNGPRMFLTTPTAALAYPAASSLMGSVGMQGLLLITIAILIIAIFASLWVKALDAHQPGWVAPSTPLPFRGAHKRLRAYVRSRRGLITLFVIFGVFNFVVGFAEVSDRAICDGFGSSQNLNIVLGIGAAGMLAASVVIVRRGLPDRPVRWLIINCLIFGIALVFGSSRPEFFVVVLATVLFLGSGAYIMAIIGTLLQTKTEPDLMGRMMGLKQLVVGITYGAGNVVAALCSNFPNNIVPGNQLKSGFWSYLVGTGEGYGRGFAALTMLLGIATVVFVVVVARRPTLRDLDTNLPDVTVEDLAQSQAEPSTVVAGDAGVPDHA